MPLLTEPALSFDSTHARPFVGYLKVNSSETLSTFGGKCPQNGSKNNLMVPRTTMGCPHEGLRVDRLTRQSTGSKKCVQEYFAHKKCPLPLGPPYDPRYSPTVGSYGGSVSYEQGTPVGPCSVAYRARAFGSRAVRCFSVAFIATYLMQGKDGLNSRLKSKKEEEEDLIRSKDGPHCEGLVSKPPLLLQRDWYLTAVQPAPAPHLAHPEGCAAPRIVLVTVPRVSRSCEHFWMDSISTSWLLLYKWKCPLIRRCLPFKNAGSSGGNDKTFQP